MTKPSCKPRVLVMMATYNGSRWVREQMDSILAQKDVEVTLRIADDCSTDDTFEVVSAYAAEHPEVHPTRNEHNLGVGENFMQMVYEGGADAYDLFAFSDQDDIWLPEKLATAAAAIKAAEEASGQDEPILYYSDLLNVSERGEERELARFAESEQHPGTVLVRNYINGCVMVCNRALFNLVRQYRPAVFPRIHDVWFHMVARFCGTVVADLDHTLVRRRLSGENVVGETKLEVGSSEEALDLARMTLSPYEHICSKTAEVFWEGYSEHVRPEYREGLEQFLHYRENLDKRIRISGSDWYWLPSPEARLRMKVGFLLGFY